MCGVGGHYEKKVLVYPCGTEIALELHRALQYSTHYEIIGGTDNYDHGRFVYRNLVKVPFITDTSGKDIILSFEKQIEPYNIDFIYPAMDGVIDVFARFRALFKEELIIPALVRPNCDVQKRQPIDV